MKSSVLNESLEMQKTMKTQMKQETTESGKKPMMKSEPEEANDEARVRRSIRSTIDSFGYPTAKP